MMENRKS